MLHGGARFTRFAGLFRLLLVFSLRDIITASKTPKANSQSGISGMLLFTTTLVLLLAAATAAPTRLGIERKRRLQAAVDSCGKNGAAGLLVHESARFTTQDSGAACVAKLVKKLDLYGANIVQRLPMARMVAIAPVNASILDSIVLDSEVELEPNCIIQLDDLPPGAPVPAQAWGIDRIDSRDGTDGFYDDSGVTGSGSLVYILDTGVRIGHVDFGGRALAGWSAGCPTGSESSCGNDVSGYVYQGVIDSSSSRCNGHGTHCASTAGGTVYGVARGATIITVQVLSCGGSGSYAGVMAGIEWAVADAQSRDLPAVLSMSLGGGGANRYDAVIQAAMAAGVLTVVAAGNNNGDACQKSPASTLEAITVGSTDIDDGRSSFSNYGPCMDIFAPGRDIKAAWSGADDATRTISGTSMATPHAAGVAAQIRSLHPALTPEEVTDAMLCMSTKDAVTQPLPADTANKLLYNKFDAADVASCLTTGPPSPPSPPPSPGSPPSPPAASPPPPSPPAASPPPPPPPSPSPPPPGPGPPLTCTTSCSVPEYRTLIAVAPSECPPNGMNFLPNCDSCELTYGDVCEGDRGVCGTDNSLDNCGAIHTSHSHLLLSSTLDNSLDNCGATSPALNQTAYPKNPVSTHPP
ncbi:subtilisin-related vacuolar protease [Emiliania huxleyi CCMP1516]|uniref:Peptidase S8/S53 domain-containing protein n=2 Tax=Emiliania huxleyi TaxID=2903 RepID=A0A0D3K1L7_EMIH1|nr:subtilisin-related vacuolar protease [Emiliania huxleyi CCMP1516]EOD29652.1 subtilisin-related vacuolar protease [Emiliania huxleyi CCMP1516]|eukprot:XP_005782081.1 subtilisin-related vacuolar protease [Emiliania huxleyi CCMP1516]